ncbi:MAG: ArsI/CadI family heavy metal resistance metalloenzyme [Cyanobacteria bacterium J06634_5]
MSLIKTHVALKVADVNRSVAFYQTLFERQPVKHKIGYAKFDVEAPGLNLTLNASETAPVQGVLSHLGIQVETADAVRAANERFKAAGLNTIEEFNTDCCYALQDKIWVIDPDGNRWEIFVVHTDDTAPELEIATKPSESTPVKACCA